MLQETPSIYEMPTIVIIEVKIEKEFASSEIDTFIKSWKDGGEEHKNLY